MKVSASSLKEKNQIILASILGADLLAIIVMVSLLESSELVSPSDITAMRATSAVFLPIAILLLNALLPSSVKAMLVFWRYRHVLPGHRAFTELGPADPRIDFERLRAHVGELPIDPKRQNALWYRLLKKVEHEVSVAHVHRQFLLLRDLASISAMLAIACVVILNLYPLGEAYLLVTMCVLVTQYVLAALGARFQGNGLVTSVLAIHSVRGES